MKIMKVRERNCNFDTIGTSLKRVMGKRFIKNGYTHVQLNGKIIKCHTIDALSGSRKVSQWSIVWLEKERS